MSTVNLISMHRSMDAHGIDWKPAIRTRHYGVLASLALLLLSAEMVFSVDHPELTSVDQVRAISDALENCGQPNHNAGATVYDLNKQSPKLVRMPLIRASDLPWFADTGSWSTPEMQSFLNAYLILDEHARTDEDSEFKTSFLHLAVALRDMDLVQQLVEHGCDANIRDSVDQTPLFIFLLTPHLIGSRDYGSIEAREVEFDDHDIAIADYLLAHGAEINATNRNGETVVYWALRWHQMRLVDYLLKHGADPNIVPNETLGGTTTPFLFQVFSTHPLIADTIQKTNLEHQSFDPRLPVLYPYLVPLSTGLQIILNMATLLTVAGLVILRRHKRRRNIAMLAPANPSVPVAAAQSQPLCPEHNPRVVEWQILMDWRACGWVPWLSAVILYILDPLVFVQVDWYLFLAIVAFSFLPMYFQSPNRPKIGLILGLVAALVSVLPIRTLLQQGLERSTVLGDRWAWVLYSTFILMLLPWSYLNLRQAWFHITFLFQRSAARKRTKFTDGDDLMDSGNWDEGGQGDVRRRNEKDNGNSDRDGDTK